MPTSASIKNHTMQNYWILGILFLLGGSPLWAQTKVKCEGVLRPTAAGLVLNGQYPLTFHLYDEGQGGTPLWSETGPVQLIEGSFIHFLGSYEPLDGQLFKTQLYLGVVYEGEEFEPRFQLTTIPYALRAASVNAVFEITGCKGAVGDVAWSLLPEALFKEQHGDCWELMRGQAIPSDSPLAQLSGLSAVPNAYGKFIRGHDNRSPSEGRQDPDRSFSTPVGTYQAESLKRHLHEVEDPGHTHSYSEKHAQSDIAHEDNSGDFNVCRGDFDAESAAHPDPTTPEDGHDTALATTGITVNPSGSGETRPQNIAVYMYMRVR